MASSPDIAKLFKSFDSNQADRYQEIVDQDRMGASEARWPILSEIRISPLRRADSAPAPDRPVSGGTDQPKSATLPAFQFLRVQDPAIESARGHVPAAAHVPPVVPAGRPEGAEQGLQALFNRLEQPRQAVHTTDRSASSPAPERQPGQMSSLFQRLRRS